MKVHLAIVYSALLLLITLQVVLFSRVGELENRLVEEPRVPQAVDTRFTALKRTLEKIAARQQAMNDEVQSQSVKVNSLARKTAEAAADKKTGDPAGQSAEGAGNPQPGEDKAVDDLLARKRDLQYIGQLFRELDANADTQVTLEEFDGDFRDFVYFDGNRSGRISRKEVEKMLEVEEEAIDKIMEIDHDGDGRISPSEFNRSSRRFRFLDGDNDGVITVDDYVAAHQKVENRIDSDDIDGDHKLSPSEFTGGPDKFKKYDDNKDKVLDRSELREMLIYGQE